MKHDIYGHHTSHCDFATAERHTERKRLAIGAALTASMMGVEIVGGILTGSLALLGDAGHMLTHFLALSVALLSIHFGSRPASDDCSYGYQRLEILGAWFNGLFVIATSIYILYESIIRFFQPVAIAAPEMFLIGGVGLVVNVVTAAILHGASHEDLNVKGAFLHVVSDTISSVGVMVAALVILFTGLTIADTIASLLIAAIIFKWGINLIRDSSRILLQATPSELDTQEIARDVRSEFPQVIDMHDIHLWTLTSRIHYLTAHIVVHDRLLRETHDLLDDLNRYLSETHGISHTTLQFEATQ